MTVHLLRGSGAREGFWWAPEPRKLPSLNPSGTSATACGMDRPNTDVVVGEKGVTCGSCKRSDEYGNNAKRRAERQREARRKAQQRTAARNRALRLLTERHADEWADLYEGELLILVLENERIPPEVPLPAIPKRTARAS